MVRLRLGPGARAVLVGFALVAGACGDDGGTSGSTPGPSTSAAQAQTTTTLQPVTGGTLMFGAFTEPRGLDPTAGGSAGAGGSEPLMAIYDTVVRFNPATRKYDMRTAESLTSSADFGEWTLKLKSGIKFSDGTDYNADAVKLSIERHQDVKNSSTARSYALFVKSMTVIDSLTLKFTLTDPWAGFPFLLSASPGMVVSPTAIAKLGTGLSLNPIGAGAGAFIVDSFKPKEAITLKKNPTYWDGPVYLDGLKFVVLTGGVATYDGFKTGTVQAAFLREAPVIAQAVADKVANYSVENQLGTMVMINHGVPVACAGGKPENVCTGKADGAVVATTPPGANAKVRQAIVAATDPQTINERTQQGKGRPSTDAFQKSFPWSPGVAGPKPDPDAAKRLVTEAKAAGWDGKVRLLANNQPSRIEWSIAVQTMLAAAGIQVTPNNDLDVAGFQAQVITKKDYDLAVWGFNVSPDDYGYVALDQNLRSDSPSNRMGYKSTAMDAALRELRLASTDSAKTAAFKKIAEVWSADAVSAIYEAAVESVIWSPKVHGLVFTQQSMTGFEKAWIAP